MIAQQLRQLNVYRNHLQSFNTGFEMEVVFSFHLSVVKIGCTGVYIMFPFCFF